MDDVLDRVRECIRTAPRDPLGNTRAPAPTATYAGIAADEQALGFALPPLLKRLYVKVGNGGWGPGYGLLGLTGGAKDDLGETAVQGYFRSREWSPPEEPSWRWPAGLLPLCHWGCGIYSCIDCTQPTFPVIAFDPNGRDAYTSWSEALFPECDGFDHWIALWAHGDDLWERLYGDGGVVEEAHYARSVEELTRHAADDFRQCAGSEHEQRAALCRYLRRGADEDFTTGELVDFLGVSSPSVLGRAGYSEEAAVRVMKMLADNKDGEIRRTTP